MDGCKVLDDERGAVVLTIIVLGNEMIGSVGADLQTCTKLPREEG
jgi:hypothetical protein